jgi:hypothetical protein
MRLQSWQVLSLPRVECYLPRHFGAAMPLRHLGTIVQPEPLQDGRRMGDTVWGTVATGQLMALSWDWIEILPGVVCMVDPINVLTNIRFMDGQDRYEEPSQAILSVNALIHGTPWHAAVCSALDNSHPVVSVPLAVTRHAHEVEQRLRRAA